jgi:hypothetical protein
LDASRKFPIQTEAIIKTPVFREEVNILVSDAMTHAKNPHATLQNCLLLLLFHVTGLRSSSVIPGERTTFYLPWKDIRLFLDRTSNGITLRTVISAKRFKSFTVNGPETREIKFMVNASALATEMWREFGSFLLVHAILTGALEQSLDSVLSGPDGQITWSPSHLNKAIFLRPTKHGFSDTPLRYEAFSDFMVDQMRNCGMSCGLW